MSSDCPGTIIEGGCYSFLGKNNCTGKIIEGGCYSFHGNARTPGGEIYNGPTWEDAEADFKNRSQGGNGHLVWIETMWEYDALARE